MATAVAETEKVEKKLDYECACCKGIHDIHDSPSKTMLNKEGILVKVCSECATSTIPRCLECGGGLEMRKFVDSWEDTKCKKPVDVNFDYYCPVCKIRWSGSPGPHYFIQKGKLVKLEGE